MDLPSKVDDACLGALNSFSKSKCVDNVQQRAKMHCRRRGKSLSCPNRVSRTPKTDSWIWLLRYHLWSLGVCSAGFRLIKKLEIVFQQLREWHTFHSKSHFNTTTTIFFFVWVINEVCLSCPSLTKLNTLNQEGHVKGNARLNYRDLEIV